MTPSVGSVVTAPLRTAAELAVAGPLLARELLPLVRDLRRLLRDLDRLASEEGELSTLLREMKVTNARSRQPAPSPPASQARRRRAPTPARRGETRRV